MQILSFKNFYLGWDKSSFFDLSVHLGKVRLECGGFIPAKNKNHGPTQKGGDE